MAQSHFNRLFLPGILLIMLAFSGCQPAWFTPTAAPEYTATVMPSATHTPTNTLTPTSLPTATATFTQTPTETPFPEPAGCRKPPEDYTRSEVNGWLLNARTLAMLQYALELWGGQIDITGWAITQGSYHDNGALSFGTHLGGGAVDLSVYSPPDWTVHYDEVEDLVYWMRVAGFAAWLRLPEEVFPESGIHIHAIAIGDAELSEAAEAQLTGTYGYFRGFNGLPQQDGIPRADRYGGPLLCQWMVELGYRDLRGE